MSERARLTRCSRIISMVPSTSSNYSSQQSELNTDYSYDVVPMFTPPHENNSMNDEFLYNCDELPTFTSANENNSLNDEALYNFDELPMFTATSENNPLHEEVLYHGSDLDFNSDDSCLDKDYVPPSLEVGERSEASNSSTNTIPDSQPINFTVPESPQNSDDDNHENLTKKGKPRKRKKYNKTPMQRKAMKKLSDNETKYQLKPGCNIDKCKKKCQSHFTQENRKNLNHFYRNMTWKEQMFFIINNTSKKQPVRITVKENRKIARNTSISYFLTNETGTKVNVCKIFFLETLGYKRKNDKSVRNALSIMTNTAPEDRRGTNPNPKKMDENNVIEHINSFNPSISHYRREHAPKRRYLPSDLSIATMFQNICEQQNINEISYDYYRKVVKKLNISFTKLGHEECEECEEYFIHNPEYKVLRHRNCQKCQDYEQHRENYISARQAYQSDAEKQNNILNNYTDTAYYAADLEKVIMLPRMEQFKKVMFCPRLIVFNESFVPLGDKKNNAASQTYAAIWHEATSGRKASDISSCIRSFLISVRDLKHIVIWLDNCASQNKNWTLYTYLVHIVNSAEVNFETIKLKYLEAGHTHMAADEFHHQVELAMKKKKNLYDFEDFHQAVSSIRTNVTVKVMNMDDFYQFEDCSSVYRLQNSSPRAYLSDMREVTFSRGTHIISYKTAFISEKEYSLDFLKLKNVKSGIPSPNSVKACRGITQDRKSAIIQKLTPLMPDNRKPFWYNLPTDKDSVDLTQVYED